MHYEGLANYYDLLINDEEGQLRYAEYVHTQLGKMLQQKPEEIKILELACGSGMLAHLLAKHGYVIDASDVSSSMITVAKKRNEAFKQEVEGNVNIPHFFELDMREFSLTKPYDVILCFCDSINYLLEDSDITSMFASVYANLKENGIFLFDCHSVDRLDEFRAGYEEANLLDDLEYQWNIDTVNEQLHQRLEIWDDSYVPTLYVEEHHVQRVYQSEFMISALQQAGFTDITITTDFDLPGVVEGEKQFYRCRRK